MRLHELIKRLSDIITPKSGKFNEYVLHTSDDNADFLRTRECWSDETVPDKKIQDAYKGVIVTAAEPLEVSGLVKTDDLVNPIHMQISYGDTEARLENAIWDITMGYKYIYIFDLESNTYSQVML